MITIRYHITLGRHGQQNALGYSIDADRRLTHDEESEIQRALSADFEGVDVTIDTEEIKPQTSDPANVIMRSLVREVEQLWPDALKGAKVDPTDARMNELERSLKLQQRATTELKDVLDRVLGVVEKLSDKLAGSAVPVVLVDKRQPVAPIPLPPSMPPQPMQFAPSAPPADFMPVDHLAPSDPPTQQQQLAASKGFPLVGTPALVAGDPSLPTNPNARGSGRTGEMQTGMMQVSGREARSSVISFHGQVDDKGQPIFATHALPKVGDSLKPESTKSDIEVPR